MKQRIQYCCEYCDAAFASQEAAEEHEAVSHFMILPEEYLTWKRLTKEACDASKTVYYHKDRNTDEALAKAIRALTDFEERHSLLHKECPKNWYF